VLASSGKVEPLASQAALSIEAPGGEDAAIQKLDKAGLLERIGTLASDEFGGRAPMSEGERLTGFSLFARAGWALTPRWLVAGDAIGWFYSEGDVDLRRGFLGGSVLFYPSSTGGFYFKGGIGSAFSDVSAGAAGDGATWGFGSALGLGYDIRLSESFNLTVGADWVFQDVSVYTQSNNQLGMLTLGLTFF